MPTAYPIPDYGTRPPAPGPAPMDHHEKMRLRAAAFRAAQVYPGPVGKILERELLAWHEFGYRLGRDSTITALVQHVMTAPLPTHRAAA